MQVLRSTSIRRLCLSVTTSVARRPQNTLLPILFRRAESFTTSSPRWYSNASQFEHRVNEESQEEKFDGVEEGKSAPPKAGDPTNTLFIANIPYSATEEDLTRIFSAYGPIVRVTLAREDRGRPKGYAHLSFESEKPALEVTEDHIKSPIIIEDRCLRIDYARPWRKEVRASPPRAGKPRREPSPTLFIGGLPNDATVEDVCEALKPLGDVVAVRLAFRKQGIHSGFGHVDFTDTTEAEKVLKHYGNHPVRILDQEIRMDRASPPETAYSPSRRLYFSKWEGDTSSLLSHFRALRSKIVDVQTFKNSDPNVLTESGFIEFCDLEAASEALMRFNTPGLVLAYAKSRSTPRKHRLPTGFGLGPTRGQDNNKREWH